MTAVIEEGSAEGVTPALPLRRVWLRRRRRCKGMCWNRGWRSSHSPRTPAVSSLAIHASSDGPPTRHGTAICGGVEEGSAEGATPAL